jgi:hypothetical protein
VEEAAACLDNVSLVGEPRMPQDSGMAGGAGAGLDLMGGAGRAAAGMAGGFYMGR